MFLVPVHVVNVQKRLYATAEFWKLNVASFANAKIPVVKIPIDAVALYLHFMDF